MTEGQKNAWKDSITPDFLRLQKAEEDAVSEDPVEVEQDSNIRENDDFSYTGSGRNFGGNNLKLPKNNFSPNKLNPKGKFGNFLKKGTPFMLVLMLLIFGLFFLFSSVGTLGDQLETIVTKATDTMFGSYSENTFRVVEELMEGKRGEFPDYFKKRLNAQDIQVESAGTGYNLVYDHQTITASTIKTEYKNNIHFRDAFTKAKRGRTSNFFDVPAAFAYSRLGISRNLFRNFKSTGNNDTDTANYKATESKLFEGTTSAASNTVTEHQKTDEDGKPVYDKDGKPVMEKVKTGDDISNKSVEGDTPSVKAKSYLANLSTRVGDAGNWACAALKVGNMISVTVAAAEIYQAINYFMSNMENISKTKAGYGDAAAANQFYNKLSEEETTTYIDANTGEEKEVRGSMMESEGILAELTGETPETTKTKNYSVESAFITTAAALAGSGVTYKVCGGIRATTAAISIVVGALSGGLASSLISLAKTVVVNVAMATAISAALGILVPKIAMSLFENSFDKLKGIPAGEQLAKGAALANKKVARSSSGQLLATKATATAYNEYTVAAAKSEAELDRETLSPFDTSSPNTFLGNITKNLATVGGATTFMSALSSITNIASPKSFASDNFKVDTDLAGTDYNAIFGDEKICENLTSIGATCDMYGSEVTASSTDTINIASDDAEYQSILSKNVRKNEAGFYEVIPNSLLANKIMFCDERDSPFGVYDTNIANAFEISLGFGENLPFVGDAVDVINALSEMSPETEGWAKGSYCVLDKDNNPYYHDLVYLQHFIEDQRVASTLKLAEVTDSDGNDKNAVVAYKNAYYKANPIDESEAGLLARYTGTSKSESEEFFAWIKYKNYVANYNPPVKETSKYHYQNNGIQEESMVGLLQNNIVYEDLRNRSYAV